MSIFLILMISLVIGVYGLANFYIGLRLWQSLGSFIPFLHPAVYWTVLSIVALSFIFGRFTSRIMPKKLIELFSVISAYWMGAMTYFILIDFLIDLIMLIGRSMKLIPSREILNIWNQPIMGVSVVLIVGAIFIYGYFNAKNPVIKNYNISIPKETPVLETLHIVMVSDIHLGRIVRKDRLLKLVEIVNGQQPDIIIFAGDIIDEDVEPYIDQNMAEEFKRLESKYGVYMALGNHEYIGSQHDDIAIQLQQANVGILRDTCVKLADSFCLVGREDIESKRFTGKDRKPLKDILKDTDTSLPIIVIDHNPSKLKEAVEAGVDLQLSGHTHAGQMFPNQWITRLMYENHWGYLKKGNFQVIVSSGFGTWGAPIRTGNSPEVVDVTVNFKKS